MTRPRVLHVATVDMSLSLLLGPQLVAFADAGYEVVTASAPGPFVRDLEAAGIRHHALEHATRAMAPLRDLRLIRELHRLFRSVRPDIVHTHTPKPNMYGRPLARAARVPVVVNTVHGLLVLPEDPGLRSTILLAMERFASRFSDLELVQSPEDLATLRELGVPAAKLRLLGNGVDLRRFDPRMADQERVDAIRAGVGAQPGDVVCGVVARLVREKGLREVVEAARLLSDRAPHVRVVVIGPHEPDKDDGLTVEEVSAAEGWGVTFLGMRSDMVDLYAAMDLFVLASYREGFPRSAMEAAAMRLPLVVTDVRGCREVVDDGMNGLLVPVRSATALAEAISQLAGDADLRRRMGDASLRKAAAEFDQGAVIRTTLDAYERLLGARDAGAPA